mgnify:CR=1 FL=1|tara:strand:+ start:189 stop:413 length:225 start_codon:yes stop_codon:yes gene_type:complete
MTLLILSLFAQAEEPKIVYKEKTEIDFEALDIEGTTKKPRQALIMENTRAIFNPLIKIREEWHKEMIESLDEIQ